MSIVSGARDDPAMFNGLLRFSISVCLIASWWTWCWEFCDAATSMKTSLLPPSYDPQRYECSHEVSRYRGFNIQKPRFSPISSLLVSIFIFLSSCGSCLMSMFSRVFSLLLLSLHTFSTSLAGIWRDERGDCGRKTKRNGTTSTHPDFSNKDGLHDGWNGWMNSGVRGNTSGDVY